MSVNSYSFIQQAQAAETPALGLALVSDPTIAHNIGSTTPQALGASTTPPITQVASGQRTLTAGAYTEDLTNLTGPTAAPVTFTGLKLVHIEITADPTNTQTLTFTQGASNPYQAFGPVASSKICLPPGGSISLYLATGGQSVDGTHKTIDVSSAQTNAKYKILMGAG